MVSNRQQTYQKKVYGTNRDDYYKFEWDANDPSTHKPFSSLRVYGKGGNDTLYGAETDSYLHGGSGHDKLYGSYGNDSLYGGGGRDRLNGGNGRDKLYGGGGNDYLNGGAHDDVLYGNNGRDFFDDNSGNNTFIGGGGADTFNIALFTDFLGNALSGVNTIKDFKAHQGDVLDLRIDAAIDNNYQNAIDEYVIATTKNGSTNISVDLDGKGGKDAIVIAKLQGVKNFDIEDAIDNGSLIV